MQTSMGDIVIELNREKAPITVKNFLSYTDKKYYDGTIFHRVMRRFMIQGGGFTEDMRKKPVDKPIKNEWKNGLKNVNGSIAMARLPRQADSATAQFFINVKDNTSLDQPNDGAGYAVFGKVVAGMKVVRAIEGSITTTKQGRANVPVETVFIKKVTRMTDDDAKKRIEDEKKSATTKPGTP
ncbi:MAG: peptidylprolyl isomerase [Planctomycetes bacterium]|nr:peptidylprolyl isomerase [Planctomycetota bacterium]